jgi:hypothetical protein
MKTFTSCALASAIALAFSVSAHAATSGDAMSHASKTKVPAACANMTGDERNNCIKEHKASGKSARANHESKSNMRMHSNDKSGSGSGSVGGSTGPAGTAGTTGSTGAGATGGTGGSAGAAGGNGGGAGK